MADKKLNDLAQIPSIGSLKNIYVEDANGNQYKVSKESLAEVLGGLLGIDTFLRRRNWAGLDANNIFETGYSIIQNNVINTPSAYGMLEVIYYDRNMCLQRFYSTENKSFFRNYSSNKWFSWVEITTK